MRCARTVEGVLGFKLASLIEAAEKGDVPATESLFEALHSELHRPAKREPACPGAYVSVRATIFCTKPILTWPTGWPTFRLPL